MFGKFDVGQMNAAARSSGKPSTEVFPATRKDRLKLRNNPGQKNPDDCDGRSISNPIQNFYYFFYYLIFNIFFAFTFCQLKDFFFGQFKLDTLYIFGARVRHIESCQGKGWLFFNYSIKKEKEKRQLCSHTLRRWSCVSWNDNIFVRKKR
jgi:hypothetical protein